MCNPVTVVTAATIAERVAAGAAWLDQQQPGWWLGIDLGKLDMQDGCLCVLGQVYAAAARDWDGELGGFDYLSGFDYARKELGVPQYDGGFSFAWPEIAALYRQDKSTEEAWAELGTEWKRLIAARRAGESR